MLFSNKNQRFLKKIEIRFITNSSRFELKLSETSDKKQLSRRDFLKLMGAAGTGLDAGKYSIDIVLKDEAENSVLSKLFFEIDKTIIDSQKPLSTLSPSQTSVDDFDYMLIIILGIVAIAIVSVFVIFKQKSKIPQKN